MTRGQKYGTCFFFKRVLVPTHLPELGTHRINQVNSSSGLKGFIINRLKQRTIREHPNETTVRKRSRIVGHYIATSIRPPGSAFDNNCMPRTTKLGAMINDVQNTIWDNKATFIIFINRRLTNVRVMSWLLTFSKECIYFQLPVSYCPIISGIFRQRLQIRTIVGR